jgi:hypothetical protein
MEKEKQQKEHCEKIKEDKAKREFIRKSLLGIGTAGIVAGVLASPLIKSVSTINTTSLSASTENLVSSWNADFLDGYHQAWYKCSGCTWTCNTACTVSCSNSCTSTCDSVCTSCNTLCDGICYGL